MLTSIKFNVDRVRILGDEHPAYKLEKRVLDGGESAYAALTDDERKDLDEFMFARFISRFITNFCDANKSELTNLDFKVLEMIYRKMMSM
jgi:hypothetical protein